MIKKNYLAVAAASVLLFSSAAHAAIITFEFSGTVSAMGGTALAAVGTPIKGTFTYDDQTKAVYVNKNLYASYELAETSFISATVDGHSITSERLMVSVVNNFGGNVQDMVDIDGDVLHVDEASYPAGGIGMRLASRWDNKKAIKEISLPSSFNVDTFDPQQSYGWVQRDGSQDGTLLQFSIDSIVVVRTCHVNGTSGAETCTE